MCISKAFPCSNFLISYNLAATHYSLSLLHTVSANLCQNPPQTVNREYILLVDIYDICATNFQVIGSSYAKTQTLIVMHSSVYGGLPSKKLKRHVMFICFIIGAK